MKTIVWFDYVHMISIKWILFEYEWMCKVYVLKYINISTLKYLNTSIEFQKLFHNLVVTIFISFLAMCNDKVMKMDTKRTL